ncbi:hypothetical protein BH23ACT10_BH23ACT10_01910 [soil metagenome]
MTGPRDLLDALPGVWAGDGEGHHPGIEPFGYRERLSFTRLGDKPIIGYGQRTTHATSGAALHTECGYLRVDGSHVELMVAQPTGFVEVHHATVVDDALAFGSTVLGRSATALRVQSVRRRWEVDGDRLTIDLWMSYARAVDEHHLHSVLWREEG